MKHSFTTRLISIVLSLLMVFGMLPLDAVHVHATETHSVDNEDTNLEIDYNRPPYKVDENGDPVYDENGQLIYLEPLQALSEAAESGREIDYTYNGEDLTYEDFYSDDYSEPQWRQVFKGDFNKLREWLESDDPDDRYIVLMEDIKKTIGSSSDWEAIEIKSQKVLDLNGHTLEFYDKRNGTTDQNTDNQYHRSNFITINGTGYTQGDDPLNPKHGALLTVIDSAGSNVTITNPKGEIATKNRETGRIYANGYMINHQKWDFWWYTHRDLFWVLDGDLVIYGGEFQAGRQKDQAKSNFTWGNLKTVIGDAVAFGTSIFEYASGITAAEAARSDLMGGDMFKDLKEDIAGSDEDEKDTGKTNNGKTDKKDGTGGTAEKKTDTPTSNGEDAEKKDQTVAQKQNDKNSKGEDEAKKGGDSKENKAEEGKDAKPAKKDPTDSQIAEANKTIGAAYLDKDKISGMVDSGMKMIEGIWDLFTSEPATIATACIHGTVARIGKECAVVIYDGNFIGHGSTPNVRNAVFEVYHDAEPSATLEGRTKGGLMYIYGGTFTANAGANVFNMYKTNGQPTAKMYEIVTTPTVDPVSAQVVYTHSRQEVTKYLDVSETFGVEEVRYENLDKWAEKYYAIPEAQRTEYEALQTSAEKEAYTGLTAEQKAIIDEGPEPVNTANIMVRGGAFRTYYELSMMAVLDARTKGTDESDGQYCPEHDKYSDDCDDVDHNKFIGTPGTVNLGVESFGEDMIKDGRIQLVDVYGQGKLVLLDGGDPIYENPEADPYEGMTEEEILAAEQEKREEEGGEPSATPVNTYQTEGGFRQYRLYISDLELRAMQYLTVHPNTALTNSTNASFALKTYWGTGNSVAVDGWASDDENIRAPYSSNEHYFEYQYDAPEAQKGVYIMPELGNMDFDAAGEDLATSDVWYYNIPVNASGETLGNFQFMDTYMSGHYVDNGGANDAWWAGGMIGGIVWTLTELLRDGKMITGDYEVSMNRLRKSGSSENTEKYKDKLTDKDYYTVTDENYRTNVKFFVYRVYRVDPLSRENINESDTWAADEPLLEMRYGATNDSLKCKITLAELEKAIAEKKGDPNWGFRSGELYRVTFSVEEHLGYGYLGSQKDGEVEFVNHLEPARAESSILFRCVGINENKDGTHVNGSNGTTVAGKVPDWTPLQFVKQDENGNYYKDENLVVGSYATVELLNGQTGIIDYEGARIFDVYYQWYILDDPNDTTPTLIAGTNDVWVAQNPYGGKQFHKPGMWELNEDGTGVNGRIYANTIDPDSPEASMYEYNAYGMPVNQDDWVEEGYQMLHMYTYETCNAHPGMIKDPDQGGLYMANNNTFWGNTDSIYIPTEYAGKYLQCKLVAVNTRYPQVFDNKQTITSHAIKIDGPSLPEFETLAPSITDAELEKGSKNLGTILESPKFAFTYTELESKYLKAGYELKPTINIRNPSNGENMDVCFTKEDCAEGYEVKSGLGRYQVELRLTLLSPSGAELDHRKMTYNMTLGYTPTITSMTPAPTAEELAAGVTNLGRLDAPISFSFTYDDTPLPEWLAAQGYEIRAYSNIYQDGKLVGAVDADEPWTPSGFGERSVTHIVELYSYQDGKAVSSKSHTFNFSLEAPGLAFKTMTPTVTDQELTAGVTALGTIDGNMPYFGFTYDNTDLPDWMFDAGYHLDGTMTIKRDGVVIEERNSLSHRPAKRVGDYEIIYTLNLLNSENEVVGTINHTYTLTVPQGKAQYLTVTTPERYFKGQSYTLTCTVGPSTASQEVTWTSSNPTVASISADGVLTCLNYGETTITVATADETIAKSFDILVTMEGDVYIGGVGMRDGQYLAQGSTLPTTAKPNDHYAYLSYAGGGIYELMLHNFSYTGKYNGIESSEELYIILEGDSYLDMSPSRDLTLSYEYYDASGIVLNFGGQIVSSSYGTLTIRNAKNGIKVSGWEMYLDNCELYFENADNAIFAEDYIDFSDMLIESDSNFYFKGNAYFYDSVVTTAEISLSGCNMNVELTDVWVLYEGISASSGGNLIVNNGGNVYLQGPWYGFGSTQTSNITVNNGGNLLMVCTTEGRANTGPIDANSWAMDINGTLTLGTEVYGYGSMERFGTDGEEYDDTKWNEYDFVFFGTDPTYFSTSVYVDPDCTVEWDGNYSLKQYDNVQIIHKHTTEYVAEIPATCTESGVCGYYICSECCKLYADEDCTTVITDTTLDALDHDWMYNTCTEPRHCVRCGLVDERYPARGHSWYPATCTDPMMCRWCDAVMGAPIDHNWVEADCWMGEHCDMCYMEISDPLGHILEGEVIVPEWAKINCSWGIEVQQWCSRCEEYVWIDVEADPSAHHWIGGDCGNPAQCEYCGTYNLLGAAHQWIDATCDAPKTCSSCGATEGEALGHNWIDATCDHPELCTNCGETVGSALGHNWKAATCSEPKTCTTCWATEGKQLGHTWDVNDCTAPGTCTVCSFTREVGDHSFSFTSATNLEHSGTCDACGATVTQKHYYGGDEFCDDCGYEHTHSLTHVPAKDATCTTTGNVEYWSCPACGMIFSDEAGTTEITETVIPETGHSWNEATCITPKTCSVCGATEGEALGHNMVGGTCTRCGYTEAVGGPQIISQPVDYVGLVGDTATFTVVAEGEGLKYQWYFYDTAASEWKKSSGNTSATLTVEFLSYRNNQQYRCQITDGDGNTVTTNSVKLIAKEVDLVIISQPVDYVGAVNDNVSFTVGATGNGLVYQWYYSDDAGATWKKSGSPGFNTATLQPILRAYRDGYQFYCLVTDIFGNSATSDIVSMAVKTGEIIIVSQPTDVDMGILGQLHTFKVTANGENLTYRWEYSEDGGNTWQLSWNQGYESSTLTVRLHAYRSGYQYRCQITSGLKTVVYTEPAVLTLQAPSAAIVKQPASVAVASGKTIQFKVEATGTDLTYQWYRSNDNGVNWVKTYLSGYSTDTLSFAANAGRAALYKCQITDGSGKIVWTNVVKLQILSAELKILTQPESVTCANGATATFTVEAQGDTLRYQWYSSADGGTTWTASYLSGYNTATFSFAVNASRASRLYKCVITDAGGNTVETNVVSVTIG